MKKQDNSDKITAKTDQRNARRHTPENVAMVGQSLKDLGAGRSIVVDRNGVVIGGNATLAEAEKLKIPMEYIHTTGDRLVVVVRDDLDTDDPRRKALALADNRSAELAEWDTDALASIVAELGDLDLTSFKFENIAPESTGTNDPEAEWKGMPEHNLKEIGETKITCLVKFLTEKDRLDFEKHIDIKLQHKGNTFSVWYPKQNFDQLGKGKVFDNESQP